MPGAWNSRLTVHFTLSGSAISQAGDHQDYQGDILNLSAVLQRHGAGQAPGATVTFTPLDDDRSEKPETVVITPTDGPVNDGPDYDLSQNGAHRATGKIYDDGESWANDQTGDCDCECDCAEITKAVSKKQAAGKHPGSPTKSAIGDPVRYGDGAQFLNSTDLLSGAGGSAFGHRRSYAAPALPGPNGNRWVVHGAHKGRLDQQMADDKSTGSDWRTMMRRSRADGIVPPHPREFESALSWSPGSERDASTEMLAVRMLFSTLVDADYIETEAHFEGDAIVPRHVRKPGPPFDAAASLRRVLDTAERLRAEAKATPRLLSLPEWLREACLCAAGRPTGLFTLTAPTGAGKTLAMLAFALARADRHRHIRRVVMVIPYLTIIDQTAKLCRELFGGLGPLVVNEDHSAARTREAVPDHEGALVWQQRLLAENWDAPIILTTSRNALESLHADGPRRCRKLHHLADSVLLFDEVQTLPPHLAEPMLATLKGPERFGMPGRERAVLYRLAAETGFRRGELASLTRVVRPGWRGAGSHRHGRLRKGAPGAAAPAVGGAGRGATHVFGYQDDRRRRVPGAGAPAFREDD